MQWKRVELTLIAVATLMSTVCAIWNAVDEYWQLGDWSGIAFFAGIWLFIPWLVALRGVLTTRSSTRRTNLVLCVVFAALFLIYAFNGSSGDRGEGAQHMHLVFVPVLLALVTLGVWIAVSLLRGVDRLRAPR
jgi:glucose dehydrogenase